MCGNIIHKQVTINGKKRNLKNRTKCLTCLPFGQSIYRKKTIDEFHARKAKNTSDYVTRFKQVNGIDPVGLHREVRRAYILGLFDNKCPFCGYSRCHRNIAFHHLSEKEHALSSREFQYSLNKTVNELKKCVPACHNCHGEIHDGLISLKIIEYHHHKFVAKLHHLDGKKWADILGPISDIIIRRARVELATKAL